MADRASTGYKSLRAFHAEVAQLDPATFGRQCGEAFLVHHGPLGDLDVAEGLQDTRVAEESEGDKAGFEPGEDFLVFTLQRSRPPTEDDDLIWLGRSEDNDVVVPDATVSAIHAFFRRMPDGAFAVQDMNSMNGTEIDGHPVPGQGMGPPVPVRPGSRLLLGHVTMTFLKAEGLHALVHRLLD